MALRVHAIETGRVQVRPLQVEPRRADVRRRLDAHRDDGWTEPLPIVAWVIEHPDGLIAVDTGETARVAEPGYLPGWHPYYRRNIRFVIEPDDEVGPRLRALGLDPADVRTVVLTHMHTDHVGGLRHFPSARVLVCAAEVAAAGGVRGRFNGYLPNRLPDRFRPEPLRFVVDEACRQFARSALIADGVRAIATPGHTPGHVSVIVEGDRPLVIAGDASYRLDLLERGLVDGVASSARRARDSLASLLDLVRSTDAVYLPTHDPGSPGRLARGMTPV